MLRVPSSTMHRLMYSSTSRRSVLSKTHQVTAQSLARPKLPSSQYNVGGRRNFSSNNTTNSSATGKTTGSTGASASEQSAAEAAHQQTLHHANETMKNYHYAKLAKLRGDLKSKRKTSHDINYTQVGVVVAFLLAFAASPFLGKKIATDKEFREKYIPAWYDFTIKRPTSELSREEVHEQILQLQKEIRARAIRGEFSDEKLAKMRRYMDGLDPDKKFDPDNDEHAWSKLHPGVEDDEEVEDE